MSASDYQMVVIGAGPAGMAAAQTAARHGARVLVLDEQPHPGGQIYRNVDASPLADSSLLGKDYLHGLQLVKAFRHAPLDYLADSSVWYLDGDGEIGVSVAGEQRRLRAQNLVIACGAQERPMPFPGWEKAGVMTAGAGQILMKSAGMVPEEAPVLAGSGPLLLLLAWQYLRAGVKIRAIVETTQNRFRWPALRHLPRAFAASDYLFKGFRLMFAIRSAGIPWYRAASDLVAEGEARLDAVSFRCKSRRQRIETRLLLLHQGVVPALQLAAAAGCEGYWNEWQQSWQTCLDDWGEASQPGIFVAGDAAGIGGARAAWLGGQLAGLRVAQRLGLLEQAQCDREAESIRNALNRHLAIRPFLDSWYRVGDDFLLPPDPTLACRCEEVSVGELRELARQGCSGPNQAKAFTRCGMGPCQGRFCGATVEQVFACEASRPRQEVGQYKVRSPLRPVTLGQLATMEVDADEH